MSEIYFNITELALKLGYKGHSGLAQMLQRYPVPPVAKIGNLSAYSHKQYEWLKYRLGPTATIRSKKDWKTPWDGTEAIIYFNYQMIGDSVGISRAHAYLLLHRYGIEHDAIAGSSKGYLPETVARFREIFNNEAYSKVLPAA